MVTCLMDLHPLFSPVGHHSFLLRSYAGNLHIGHQQHTSCQPYDTWRRQTSPHQGRYLVLIVHFPQMRQDITKLVRLFHQVLRVQLHHTQECCHSTWTSKGVEFIKWILKWTSHFISQLSDIDEYANIGTIQSISIQTFGLFLIWGSWLIAE